MPSSRYPIPAENCRCETEVDRSRFIATVTQATTPEEAAEFVARIKAEFPDANHNCWAYLVGPPGSSDRIGLSDDGEPHGVAGKPILTTLQHSGIGDIVIVVTRYFGGIKLGKGGMVKAYTLAAQNALSSLAVGEKINWTELTLRFDYSLLQQIELLLPRYEAEILERTFSAQVTLTMRCPDEQKNAMAKTITDLCHGQIDINTKETN